MREVKFEGIVKYSTGENVQVSRKVNLYESIDMVDLPSLFNEEGGEALSKENFLGLEGKCFDLITNEEVAELW